jgi:hypothetical protein
MLQNMDDVEDCLKCFILLSLMKQLSTFFICEQIPVCISTFLQMLKKTEKIMSVNLL